MRWLTLVGILACLNSSAQFEWGGGVGAFAQQLIVLDMGSGASYLENTKTVLPSLGIAFRDRSPTKSNLFLELAWMHRSFFAHLDDSGKGGGVRTDIDVRLEQLYFTFGPEWGRGRNTFRLGPQFGWLLGGRVVGTEKSWAMYPQPNGDTTREIDTAAGAYFKGDFHLLLAGRITRQVMDRLSISMEPFLAWPLVRMSSEANVVHSIDLGLRVNLFRSYASRGLLPRLTASR